MFAEPTLFIARLVFVGLMIEAVELLALRRTFDTGGLFATNTVRILLSGSRWPAHGGGSSFVAAVAGLQLTAAMMVVAQGTGTRCGIVAALVCLATNISLRARRQIGGSGADQLTFMVLVTFGLVMAAGGDAMARRIGDAFLAAQVVLAYFAAGVSKAASPTWRSGRALGAILSTEGYGVPSLGLFLGSHPNVDRVVSWSVIVWETAFPLALLAPRSVLFAMLLVGALFHATCAVVMGLNRFVWAFCGCYSAVWATSKLLHG
jgi:hypothetical protein